MALAEQSSLIVTIRLNDQMSPTAVRVGKSMADLERKTVSLRRATSRLGEGLRTGIGNAAKVAAVGVGILAYNVKQGINELVEWEDAQLQISAALKSTNQVAGITASKTEELANKYAELTNYEDDVVLGAEAILLRFPAIRKKAFEPTLAAATDLAAGMGRDLPTAARTLAMALNNPTAGLSRLTRAGVSFTDAQQKQIKALVEAGKVQKAQEIILGRVNKVYGGSAQKATEGYRGSMVRLDKAIKSLQQSLAEPLMGPLSRLAKRLAEFAKDPEVQKGIRELGQGIAGLFSDENLTAGVAAMKDGFTFLQGLDWTKIREAVGTSTDILKAAISTFTSLDPKIQGALLSFLAVNKFTGGLGTAALKGIGELVLNGLKTINAVNVTVVGANVTGVGDGKTPPVPSPKFDLKGLLTQMGARSWPIISLALELDDRAQALNETIDRARTAWEATFRSGFATGTQTGTDIRMGKSMTPREAQARIAIIQQTLVQRTAAGLFPAGGPGAGRTGLQTSTTPMRTLELMQRLIDQGKISGERALNIWEATQNGTRTFKSALAELKQIKGAQGEVKEAIKGIRYQFTLKPSVVISASETGGKIVFASNGQRLVIE